MGASQSGRPARTPLAGAPRVASTRSRSRKPPGELALDLAYHIADARLRVLEAIEVEDGGVRLRPWQDPFPFWCREGDLSP
jgi:hypothetical protein